MPNNEEQIPCHECGEWVRRDNMHRHFKKKHDIFYTTKADVYFGRRLDQVLDMMPDEMKNMWESLHLDDLQAVNPIKRAIWSRSTVTFPEILSSGECWSDTQPEENQVYNAILNTVEDSNEKVRSYVVVSETEARIGRVLGQLDNSEIHENLYATNVDCKLSGSSLRPPDIPDEVSLDTSSDFQVYILPKQSFVDLKHNIGLDLVASPIKYCSVHWIMFPPSVENLRALKQSRKKWKFKDIAGQLEGGIYTQTTSKAALLVPAGTIFGILTVLHGYLAYKSYTRSTSLPVLANFLEMEITIGKKCFEDLVKVLLNYKQSLHLSLACLDESNLQGNLLDMFNFNRILLNTSIVNEFETIIREIEALWIVHLSHWDVYLNKMAQCPCGLDFENPYIDHLKVFHLIYTC